MADAGISNAGPIPTAHASTGHGWIYLVAVLTIGYVLNFVDRQVVNILAEPIKRDLGLRDWQLGVMTGLSFALVYGMMALPIARLAERFNRPWLISIALCVWSGSTLLCGMAQSFGQLAAARVAVGIGESGYTPSAHSLITQGVPKSRRTLAFAIFGTGLPLGSIVALAIGGLVADIWGWRAAFLLAGLPGFVIAALVFFTIDEPRGKAPHHGGPRRQFLRDARVLLSKRALLLFVLASGLFATTGYGMQAFIASFFLRLHGDQLDLVAALIRNATGLSLGRTAIVGPALGLIGLGGIASALLSGIGTDRLVARDVRYFGWVAGSPLLLAGPVLIAALVAPGIGTALALFGIYYLLSGFASPPISSCIQSLAPPELRATASALALLALVLFGNGVGPFWVGLLSDLIASTGRDSGEALRAALVISTAPLLASAGLFLLATRYLRKELGENGVAQ